MAQQLPVISELAQTLLLSINYSSITHIYTFSVVNWTQSILKV